MTDKHGKVLNLISNWRKYKLKPQIPQMTKMAENK